MSKKNKQITNDTAQTTVEGLPSAKVSNNKLQTQKSGVEEIITLYPEDSNLIINQVKKNHIQVLSLPAMREQDFRVIVSNVNMLNNIAEQQLVVKDKALSSRVTKKKKLPVQPISPILKQPQVCNKNKLSNKNILVSKKLIDNANLKQLQTSPIGKHTKPKQTIINNTEVHDSKKAAIEIKQVNPSPVKTNKIIKKTNLPIKNDLDKVNESAGLTNDKNNKREREKTVLQNNNEKYEIPRKKKVKTDLKVSNELKNPPNNDIDVVKKITKKKSSLNDNNANAKRALIAKTQLFGDDTIMTDEKIDDLITPKQTMKTKTIVSIETVEEKVLTYDEETKSKAKESNNQSKKKIVANDEDEDDDDAKSNETDIGKKPKIGNREMAGLKFAREYGKESFHVLDDPASDNNQRSTRKKLQINDKGSAHGT